MYSKLVINEQAMYHSFPLHELFRRRIYPTIYMLLYATKIVDFVDATNKKFYSLQVNALIL